MRYCADHALPHSQYLSWDEDDRDKLIAYLIEEGDRCQQCGTKESEWAEDRFAYVAEVHHCMGCYVQEGEQENIKGSLPGTTIKLVANTPLKQAQVARDAQLQREMFSEE